MEHPKSSLFTNVPDPRVEGRCDHKLSDILFIALSCLICNGEDFEDMVEFGHQRYDWLRSELSLPNGIPSHDTFNRVFQMISPAALQQCLIEDGRHLLDKISDKHISFDGKKIKGVHPKSRGNKGLYILTAWVNEHNLCIGQQKVEDKSNEITVIPKLLDSIGIEGATISIDALGCQKEIADKITKNGGDYLLSLKKNQKNTFNQVEKAFALDIHIDQEEEWEYDHGRYETRKCSIIPVADLPENEILSQWKELTMLVRVEAHRHINNEVASETRYYLSSSDKEDAKYYNRLVRGHWGIENRLHWHLDVTFKEDASRARTGNAPENLNILRKIALSRIGQMTDKLSKKKRRYRASLNNDYLKSILNV